MTSRSSLEKGQRVVFSTELRPDEKMHGFYSRESNVADGRVFISAKKGGTAGWWTDLSLVEAAEPPPSSRKKRR